MLSYAEITETDAYFSGRTDAGHWQKLSEEEKKTALEQASRILDQMFDWIGTPSAVGQTLRWPRKDAVDLDGVPLDPETIPVRIRQAAMEQALYLTDPVSGNTAILAGSGIKSASAGSMSIALDPGAERSLLAPSSGMLVRGFGSLRMPGCGNASCGTLIRG